MTTESRVCSKCGEVKTKFPINQRGNVSRYCTDCLSKRRHEYHVKYHATTPEQKLAWALRSVKNKCARLHIPFNIELQDFLPIPTICPALNIPMNYEGRRDSQPTFDKVVPSLGYIKGNVHLISHRANRMKSDATPQEMANLEAWMKRTYEQI